MSEAYRHPVADCERCQANIVLYGMSYMRISTDEHIDPPDLLVIVGPVNKKLYPPAVLALRVAAASWCEYVSGLRATRPRSARGGRAT